MEKIISLLFCFLFLLNNAQYRVKVLDKETSRPINNAKIFIDGIVTYTNEDGVFEIFRNSRTENNILVSAPSYEDYYIKNNDTEIYLEPKYNKIEEVVIGNIDLYNTIAKISDNYYKYYNTEQSLFDAQFKDKLLVDKKINSLSISDIKIWALDNQYDFRYKNLDKFLQISLDKVRYYKVDNSEINFKKFSNEKAIKSFNTRIFLNGELILLKRALKGISIKSNVVYEDNEIMKITFQSKGSIQSGISFKGIIHINKLDEAITYMEVEQIQDKSTKKYKSGRDSFNLSTNSVIVTYDFYKKNGKYVPARYTCIQSGIFEQKGVEKDFYRVREIIFSSQETTSKKGVNNKIDMSKDIISHIPDTEIKDNKTLLSSQEKVFINE